jgi:hypothetical protein
MDLKELGWEVQGELVGCCENGDELLCSVKCGNSRLDEELLFLKNGSDVWNWLVGQILFGLFMIFLLCIA